MTTPRRWFAFRLRTLLVVVAVLSAPLAWVVHEYKVVRLREMLICSLEASNPLPEVRLGHPDSISWMRRMMGDVAVERIAFPSDFPWPENVDDFRQAFSEAEVSMAGTR
jgi:hypothetical protein